MHINVRYKVFSIQNLFNSVMISSNTSQCLEDEIWERYDDEKSEKKKSQNKLNTPGKTYEINEMNNELVWVGTVQWRSQKLQYKMTKEEEKIQDESNWPKTSVEFDNKENWEQRIVLNSLRTIEFKENREQIFDLKLTERREIQIQRKQMEIEDESVGLEVSKRK